MPFPVWILLCLSLGSTAIRLVRNPGIERVCGISERSGEEMYGIGFSLNMHECSDTTNCNFWVLKEKIAPKFIAEPVKSNPRTTFGKCSCYLLGEPSVLVRYIYTPGVPCDIPHCWEHYNQFVSIVASKNDPEINFRNHSGNGNHWDIKCGNGPSSLSGLLTNAQLLAKLSKKDQDEIIGVARREGIVPASRKDIVSASSDSVELVDSGSKVVENVASSEQEVHNILDGNGISDVSLEETPSPGKTIKLANHVEEVDFSVSLVKEAQQNAVAYVNAVEVHNEQERQAREQFLSHLQISLEMLERLRIKLLRLMDQADGYLQHCQLWVEGKINKAFGEDTSDYILYLRGGIVGVAIRLLENVEAFHAFDYATQLNSMDPRDLDRILQDLLNTFQMQALASSDLEVSAKMLLQAVEQVYHAKKAVHEQKSSYKQLVVVHGRMATESALNVIVALQKVKDKMGEAIDALSAIRTSFV